MACRRWSMPSGTQRKKCQKLWKGEVLPLDGSLLMGGFSDLQSQQVWVRISGWYPALHQKSGQYAGPPVNKTFSSSL